MDIIPVQNALISVSNKSGLAEFARQLTETFNIKIYSTGGTFKFLHQHGIPAEKIEDLTQMPALLDGRVKTLHPAIFSGILARRDRPEDIQTLKQRGFPLFDLVVVNLYPFAETIRKKDVTESECIENIDIGGIALLRAAAKNFYFVTIVTSPEDYPLILAELRTHRGITPETRRRLAIKAFRVSADYDDTILRYFSRNEKFPEILTLRLERNSVLRYGENPHQQAAFYRQDTELLSSSNRHESSVTHAKQLHGKQLSYNNIADTDTALEIVREFAEPAVAIIKHANPCGVARAESILQAYKKALECDPVSAFGGIVALNRPVDTATAEAISAIFTEVVIAPAFDESALSILTKKKNLRLLETGELTPPSPSLTFKSVVGGMLVQDKDLGVITARELKVVTNAQPTQDDIDALLFAWKVVKWVKSNAIVFTTKDRTIGIGAGQMSRIDAAHLAAKKARSSLKGTYMASDAFFPFRDSVDFAAELGVRAIIQPGGSVRDQESIDAANEHGLIMVFTGLRHFRH
ncbi:bifunctional phosphoribosylaminoimidazolecarboxamide formyltransferase/IMP cyclohydrolase [Candidatus Sumerlaeota bacterium]|nr:bifunctional phosphoribosylaminoimidazolecarboxamide formyltransferase/IMP cyclohydrolase [Candidatus Sumerlaeota bacterium]